MASVPPVSRTIAVVLTAGDQAPSLELLDIATGQAVADPWTDGRLVLAFFKISCPVCKMVGPMLTKLAEGGARVVAVGEDAPEDLTAYADEFGQRVPVTLAEPAPYEVAAAYGLEAVPSIFVIDDNGEIETAVAGWSRDVWNELAASVGVTEPLSTPDDGLRPFRPG
jgi:peroxiredoxin